MKGARGRTVKHRIPYGASRVRERGGAAVRGEHGYLTWLMPVAAALLFMAIAELAGRFHDPAPGAPGDLPRRRTLWLMATASLLAVFFVQEGVESFIAHGHPPAPLDLLAGGGWVSVPLAVAAGAALALALSSAASAIRWALARVRTPARRTGAPRAVPSPSRIAPIALPVQKAGPGHYTAPGATFGVAGDWDVEVAARVGEFDLYATTLEVPVE